MVLLTCSEGRGGAADLEEEAGRTGRRPCEVGEGLRLGLGWPGNSEGRGTPAGMGTPHVRTAW